MQETNVDVELIEKNHQQAKKYITSKLRKHQMTKIYKAAENKSEVRDYVVPQNNRNSNNKTNLHEQSNTQGMQQYIQHTCQNDKG